MEGHDPGSLSSEQLSPWQRVLGATPGGLHPRLRAYFSAIPSGHVGRGSGTFDRVGTPRRWLWPALAVLGRAGIVFPVWGREVPFAVENRPDGAVLRARRTFRFPGGDRVMVDAVAMERGVLVDRLGAAGSLRVELDVSVVDGALRLHSRRAAWRGIPIPFAPRVTLVESWDEDAGRQHVALTLDAPLVGRVYEYDGRFDYAVESA